MKQNFYNRFIDYALKAEQKTGIPHLFLLAQSALETAWGKKAPGNMYFGVKATKNTPENKKQLLKTTEYSKDGNLVFPQIISKKKIANGSYEYIVKDWFRKFNSAEESWDFQGEFLSKLDRYKKAISLHKNDPYKFAEYIAGAGYATASNYATSLKTIIKEMENFSKKK